jgi:hypothetical protein
MSQRLVPSHLAPGAYDISDSSHFKCVMDMFVDARNGDLDFSKTSYKPSFFKAVEQLIDRHKLIPVGYTVDGYEGLLYNSLHSVSRLLDSLR